MELGQLPSLCHVGSRKCHFTLHLERQEILKKRTEKLQGEEVTCRYMTATKLLFPGTLGFSYSKWK